MSPRRAALTLAAASTLALGLAACGGNEDPVAATPSASATTTESASPSPSRTTSSPAATRTLPSVKGGFGEPPSIKVPDVDPPGDLVVKTLSSGSGTAVEAGEIVIVDYAGVRWEDGATFDSSFDRGSPAGFSIGTGAVIPGWDSGLVGVKAGSRVLMVIPPDQAYGDTPPGDPIQPGDTLVFVVDVLGSLSPTAKGDPAPVEDDTLPYVGISPREPDIVIPNRDPYTKLITIPVVVGKGPEVQKGDTVVVQYKGVLWRNGKEFDSSWGRGQPFVTQIGVGAVVPGWDKGLVGQTVGSRVLLVVPPKDGYGSSGNGQIRGTDTMVFAVDILGAY